MILALFDSLLPFLAILLLLIAAAGFFKLSQKNDSTETPYPYHRERQLLTIAESRFLGVLEQALPEGFRVFVKVRLCDLLKVKRRMKRSARQTAFNRISSKHIDFVVCSKSDHEVHLLIELDDSSHLSIERKKRDEFVNKAVDAAFVPLLRVPVKREYSVRHLSQQISEHLPAVSSPQLQSV